MSVEPEGIQPCFLQMAYWVFNFFFSHNPGALQNAARFLIMFYPSRSVFLFSSNFLMPFSPHCILSHWFVCSPRTFPVSPFCSWPLTSLVSALLKWARCTFLLHACMCVWVNGQVSKQEHRAKDAIWAVLLPGVTTELLALQAKTSP